MGRLGSNGVRMMAAERFHQNATALHLATSLLPSSPYSRWPVRLMQTGVASGTAARSTIGTLVQRTAARPARTLPIDGKGAPRSMRDILVIASDPATRELLRRALEAQGYAVAVASNGTEAIACLQESQCRLLLLDLTMPRADGLRVLRSLRSHPAQRPPGRDRPLGRPRALEVKGSTRNPVPRSGHRM